MEIYTYDIQRVKKYYYFFKKKLKKVYIYPLRFLKFQNKSYTHVTQTLVGTTTYTQETHTDATEE
jgi:hypothetical protein